MRGALIRLSPEMRMHLAISVTVASATAFQERKRLQSRLYPAELLALEVFWDRIVPTSTGTGLPEHRQRRGP